MKIFNSFFLLMALVAISFYSHAHVLTCNNKTPSPGQYATLTAAYTAATAGDTIYFSGSSISYGTLTVTKKITFVGTGFNPTDKQDNSISTLGLISLSTGSDNSSFEGLVFGGVSVGGVSISGISIMRCLCNSSIVIGSGTLTNLKIDGCQEQSGVLINGAPMNVNTSTISNNVIVTSANAALGAMTSFSSVNIFNNDVINGKPLQESSFVNCNIYNNIFWGPAMTLDLTINGTNTGNTASNNVDEGPAGFTNFNTSTLTNNIQTNAGIFINWVTGNYHLSSASPALVEGTDGTDAGIYGGAFSNSYLDTGEPAIPQIRALTAPTTVPANGSVNVNVISTRKQ